MIRLDKIMLINRIKAPAGHRERKCTMSKTRTIFTLLALFCIPASLFAGVVGYNGTVTVESKTVMPDQSFSVEVSLAGNDIAISSMRIPLEVSDPNITCTGVDFSGSLAAAGIATDFNIDGSNIDLYFTPELSATPTTIAAASGKLATLHFTSDPASPETDITISAVSVDNPFVVGSTTYHRWDRMEFTDESGTDVMVPSFNAGTIAVRFTTDVDDFENNLPADFALAQNYPNPFNPSTTIEFSLPEKAHVTLDIYNLLGQKVATLSDGDYSAGVYSVVWRAENAASGIYFYRLNAGAEVITRKMALLK